MASKQNHIAIKVNKLDKQFRLPQEQNQSLKRALVHPIKHFKNKSISKTALKGLDFEIENGEFFGIVGRNGSGKSTLLKLIAGIYQPTKGSIKVNGSLVPFIELGVGFNPELTGRENIYLSAALLGFTAHETEDIYDDIVDFAELSEFMEQKLKNYSSGMQVRLAFSIAIRAQADILLLDEVLAVGDAAFQRKCFNYFRVLKKQKKTVILVTHDMSAVREYCTRAMLIDDSKILKIDEPEKIAQRYNRLFEVKTGDEGEADDDTELKTRYGNNDLKFKKVISPKILNDDDEFLEVKVNIKAYNEVKGVNFGISVKDAGDAYVCGTNTRLLGLKFDKISKGQEINLTWKIPNIFHDGKHYINVAAVDMSEATQFDWWDEAAYFTVYREIQTPYIVSPEIKVKEVKDE